MWNPRRGALRSARALLLLLAAALSVGSAAATDAAHFLTEEEAVARVLDLADQRLALMPGVAATKWQTHASILDPERERVVIRHAGELATPLGLSAEPVENFFQVQVRLARELELRLTDQWAQHGFQFSGAIPDLATQIRPQLDEVTTQMLRALYLAAPALRQPGFIDRYTEVAHRHLQGEGWSQDSRRELLATLAVVRQKSAPALQRVAAAGVLRVGLTGDYAPFSLEVQGAVSGADVELARELADDLHAKPVFIRTSWKSLLDDLGHDDFDLVMGGVSITPERQGRAEFSVAYASGGKTIIARCADKARYAGLASVDRSSVRVIVNPGGTNEQFVRANLRNARIRVYPDNRTIFDEIRSGRADVMITDDTEVDLQTQRHADLCRALAGTLTHADKAILMQRDPPLVAAVNTWLSAQIAAGEPAQLLQRAISN